VIRGEKTFLSNIYVKNLKIGENAYYGSKKINNVDVLHLNRTIFRNVDIVQSKKSFTQLHVEEVLMNGKINGISWNSLAFVTKNDLKLPQLAINELEVFDLLFAEILHRLSNEKARSLRLPENRSIFLTTLL
jgi:hypothetical protein